MTKHMGTKLVTLLVVAALVAALAGFQLWLFNITW